MYILSYTNIKGNVLVLSFDGLIFFKHVINKLWLVKSQTSFLFSLMQYRSCRSFARRFPPSRELELELESASSFIQFNLTAGSHVGHGGMSSKAVRDTCKMRWASLDFKPPIQFFLNLLMRQIESQKAVLKWATQTLIIRVCLQVMSEQHVRQETVSQD